MTIFISIVIIAIVLIYYFAKNNSTEATSLSPASSKNSLKKNPAQEENNQLYKKKGIKRFEMKGMYYRNLNPKTDNGAFIGLAKCEDNSHDMYAVGIYNTENKLLGYTPKRNKRLNISLNTWHNGTVPVWGSLRYNTYDDKWYGSVYIPMGYTLGYIEKLERVLKLQRENENQIKRKEKETDTYFEILNRHHEIISLLTDLNNPEELYYSFPKNLIASISGHLTKEKNWEKLIELEKHDDLINELNDKFKDTTLKRIRLAKENLS